MPDISMCANRTCPKAKDCYRFRAIPNPYRQAYSSFAPDESGHCGYFSPIEGYSEQYLQPYPKDNNENHRT